MIEELKMVLDTVGDLSGIAGYIIGFFITFKLIVYLSTAGSIVFILKLAINRIHSAMTLPPHPSPPKVFTFRDVAIDEDVKVRLERLVYNARGSGHKFIHNSDVSWMEKAFKVARENEAAE